MHHYLALATSFWGLFVFYTIRAWMVTARNTIEPGRRYLRLRALLVRWYLGLFAMALLLLELFFIDFSETNNALKVSMMGWGLIVIGELYFLVRFRLLYDNFRKFATILHTVDSLLGYATLLGGVTTLVGAM